MRWTDEACGWMALSRAPALDGALLADSLGRWHDVLGVLNAADNERRRAGFSAAACEFLESAAALPSAAERTWLENPQHRVLPFTDPRYPAQLRVLERQPLVLYLAGNERALEDPQLAVVGSRNPTPAGRDIAFEFAAELARCGLGITSGLAEGIDGAAHRGALAVQGVSIAVLGCGIDVPYPRSHRELAGAIQMDGALLSEFPLGTAPRRENFPRRNRIIAALSMGTLVVEAASRSGSLITARMAGEHNREVFAVPGSIRSPQSRGCHELIRQGAKLTESASDILSELDFSPFFARSRHAPPGPAAAGPEAGMDKEHKILLDALGFDLVGLDVLVARSGFKPAAVSSMMLILELEGHVQAAPGGLYSRVARSRR